MYERNNEIVKSQNNNVMPANGHNEARATSNKPQSEDVNFKNEYNRVCLLLKDVRSENESLKKESDEMQHKYEKLKKEFDELKANHEKLTSEHAETENNLIALKDGILKAVLDKKTYNFLSTHIKNNKIEHIIEAVAGFKKVYTDKKPIQTDNKSSNEPNETDNKSLKDASETDNKSSKASDETDNKSSED